MPKHDDFEERARHFAEAVDIAEDLRGVRELVKRVLKQSAERVEAISLPPELNKVREAARRAMQPLKAADASTQAPKNLLFAAKRTEACRNLPAHYLVYFLLVELLGFRDLGRFEKLAWSVPVELDGVVYLIEHRKFGVGVFAGDAQDTEQQAQRVVALVRKGVGAAKPYFKWLADRAVSQSKINVSNVGRMLFERYTYFRDSFRNASTEAAATKSLYDAQKGQREFGFPLSISKELQGGSKSDLLTALTIPWILNAQHASWLAIAAIDAFFGWTEHIFIHLGILQGEVTTGTEVANLVAAEWSEKFKRSLDVGHPATKAHFDELVTIRRQLRNFMAHGAFGKEGEGFKFHSRAGAVPVVLDRRPNKPHFSLTPELAFDDSKALATMEAFIEHLWSGPRKAAQLYIQESDLPLILPLAKDGTYKTAMASVEAMQRFIDSLTRAFDDAANMEW